MRGRDQRARGAVRGTHMETGAELGRRHLLGQARRVLPVLRASAGHPTPFPLPPCSNSRPQASHRRVHKPGGNLNHPGDLS